MVPKIHRGASESTLLIKALSRAVATLCHDRDLLASEAPKMFHRGRNQFGAETAATCVGSERKQANRTGSVFGYMACDISHRFRCLFRDEYRVRGGITGVFDPGLI